MVKKYFALSLITASVLLAAGCSSDDDDDDGVDPNPDFVVTPGVGGSVYDYIVNTSTLSTLKTAIDTAELDVVLDNEANAYTVFAPDDAAFQALEDATPGTIAGLLADPDALARVLLYHVLAGEVTSTELSTAATAATAATEDAPATFPTLLEDESVTIATSDTAPLGLTVDDVFISGANLVPEVADGETTTGLVHTITEVLTPPEDTTPDPTDPTPGAGEVQAALEAAGIYTSFLSGFGSSFGLQKLDAATDPDPWTVFAPTDAALDGGEFVVNNHISTGEKLTPAQLLDAGTFTSFNNISYPVGGTVEALTVGGHPVTVVGEAASITYSIDGVLE